MLSQLTIPKKKTQQLSLDHQQLYAIGLKHIQQLSSQIWTDYNVHDPGITTLELLCYALTDLSYRASFPIEDLLASESDNAEEMKKQFFTARQILPNRPLTKLDYRKLLIDLPGVKNAWVEPTRQSYYADPVKGELLGTPRLFTEELINLPLFATRLKQVTPDSVSRYVLSQLREVTRQALNNYKGIESEAEPLLTLLVQDLNQIIQGDAFYQTQWLNEFTLSPETQSLITQYQQVTVEKRVKEEISDRLNRLLLEDVYPEAIARYHLLIEKIIDLPSFTAKLKQTSPDPVSGYLFEQLRDVTRQALAVYEGAHSEAQPLHPLLVQDLNRIVQGDSIYEEQRFSGFALSPPTLGLIALQQQLNGDNRSSTKISNRLNRLLLNDIYPQEVARYHPLRTTAALRSIKKVNLAGLYEVIIDYMDDITTLDQKETVMREVKQRLHANRNLCEDFVHFTEVETQSFQLCAELELTPDADVNKLNAAILFQVQQYLSPPVRFYTLSEMLTRTKSAGVVTAVEVTASGTGYTSAPTISFTGGGGTGATATVTVLNGVVTASEVTAGGKGYTSASTISFMGGGGTGAAAKATISGTPYTVDEIFEGSALEHGFIDGNELEKADLREEIRLSDIINIIMDIEGVQAVRDIVINPEGNKVPLVNKWVIPVEAGKQAKLNPHRSRLVFYKRNMPVVPSKVSAAPSTVQTAADVTNDLPIPLGKYRELASYYSFQNHFPAIYGLSDVGLSSTADDKRKALADQLKAYLLFFDQIMANYMAQLSHVKELFSTNADLKRTYFYQVVDSFADYSKIYRNTFVTDDFTNLALFADKLKAHSDGVSQFLWSQFSAETQQLIADYAEEEAQIQPLKIALAEELNRIIKADSIYLCFAAVQLAEETQKMLQQNLQGDELLLLNRLLLQEAYPLEIAKWNGEEKTRFDDRRNRFLDHLIARFAERFHDFVNIMYSVFGESTESIISYKCKFLNSYPTISSERSLAYNYSLTNENELWNTDNVSGLEKRLAKLLGIRNYQRRNLGEIAYDIYAEVDEDITSKFRFRIRKQDTLEIILSSTTKYATPELAKTAMEQAIHFALLPSGYQRKVATDGRYYFNIIDDLEEIVARRIEYFNTEAEMNRAIDELMDYLSAEGMYLIENILLRPEQNSDPFLPICPTPNCTDCAEIDPYSYRITIILPAYSDRFKNMNFRRFAEEVIREETPAHILPKICWINKDDMAELEKLYRDWIDLKAGVEKGGKKTDREDKLKKFIEKLFAVKSVYPPQKLHDCDSSEDALLVFWWEWYLAIQSSQPMNAEKLDWWFISLAYHLISRRTGEDQPKFILGRTVLGSEKTIET